MKLLAFRAEKEGTSSLSENSVTNWQCAQLEQSVVELIKRMHLTVRYGRLKKIAPT